MAEDTKYVPVPLVYKSRGMVAREIQDQMPPNTFLDMLNCYERDENAMSSRYGTQIINRDAVGSGTSNHYFTSPAVTLARLAYQGASYRYAGLSDGSLQRRTGDSQGAYSSIYTGLSGEPFGWLTSRCFETSQPYLFVYDSDVSIKDSGVIAAPQLTGIDPPLFTAAVNPYSPLLTMIDNFASGNTYSTGSVTGWAYGLVTTLSATSGQLVTDFPEFFGIQQSGALSYTPSPTSSATASVTVTGTTGSDTSTAVASYTSVPLSAGDTISVVVNLEASMTFSGPGGGGGLNFEQSIDGGATWSSFFGWSASSTQSFGPTNITVTITGIGNLDTVQFRVIATAASGGAPPPTITASGTINSAVATVTSPAVFGGAVNGMLSVLNTNTTIDVPIVSVASSGLTAGLYTTLTVTTQAVHGLSVGDAIALYGTSNEIVNGFYTVLSTPTTTTFTVGFTSSMALGATGGTVMGGAAAPSACVIQNLYSSPYPPQLSAWGFYQSVPTSTASFPVGTFSGSIAASTTGTIGKTVGLDLSQNGQVTDDDLIVLTLNITNPQNVLNVRLQFDVNGSTYSSTYYYKDISPAYYQGGIVGTVSAYNATENQILANSLNLISGQPPGSTSAQLQPANFSTGSGAWTTIYLRRGDFLPIGNAGQSGTDWANITGWELVVTTNSGGSATVSANGLYLQWGFGPSSFGGVGFDYRYTYYNAATGTESNGSDIQDFSELFGYLATLTPPVFLRQAGRIVGAWSLDTQVTHVRVYRRGGILSSGWRQIGQFPNVSGTESFFFKDTISDVDIEQAKTLVLDNDPPVTASLVTPISTQLAAATLNLIGQTPYQPFVTQQVVTVADNTASFVQGQLVLVGNSNNLEQVRVQTGGTGQFTATFFLQHNAGEPVNAYSVPRSKCNICCIANDGTVYLAGDKNNPHYVYRSKPNNPESFGPQDYTPVSSPDDPVMAIINWRGTIVAATLKTWYILPGGNSRPVPTGAAHGLVSLTGWTLAEGGIWFRANDGLRFFTGADGNYMTLPVEWIYQGNPLCIPPQAYQPDASQDVLAFYNNTVYDSFISNSAGSAGPRYRMAYSTVYKRFRYDDLPATAMLWEQDTNAFLVAKQMGVGQYAIVQDWIGDYDDGGWSAGALVQTPINLAIQTPYFDLESPHAPKQFNALETDVNTQGQTLNTQLLFDDGTVPSLTLPTISTSQRTKVQSPITPGGAPAGSGQQAYRASIRHTIAVTVAPILYQEDVYAATLAAFKYTLDSYQLEFGTTEFKLVKEALFDITSTTTINFSLYAEGLTTPYYTFTLPASPARATIRVRFPALTLRMFRIIGNIASGQAGAQFWSAPEIRFKLCRESSGYQLYDVVV